MGHKKLIDATGLEYKYIKSCQFDAVETEESDDFNYDMRDEALLGMRINIGHILVVFSSLEHEIELCMGNLFSNRSSHLGMQVNKYIDYIDKALLLTEMLTNYILVNGHGELLYDVKEMSNQLIKVGELRNVIAHAKWFSLTKDGFIRNKVKLDRETGFMHVKYYKLNNESLHCISEEIQSAEIMLAEIIFKLSIN